MRCHVKGQVLFVLCSLSLGSLAASNRGDVPAPTERTFEFSYKVIAPASPAVRGSLRIWIPLPAEDSYQQITELKIEAPVPYDIEKEPEYGNRMAVFRMDLRKSRAPAEIVLHFR